MPTPALSRTMLPLTTGFARRKIPMPCDLCVGRTIRACIDYRDTSLIRKSQPENRHSAFINTEELSGERTPQASFLQYSRLDHSDITFSRIIVPENEQAAVSGGWW